MKEVQKYKTLFKRKRKVRLEGMVTGYDGIQVRDMYYIIFYNIVNDKKIYYLHSLITGKLLLITEYEIRLRYIYDYIMLEVDAFKKTKYLFKITYDDKKEYSSIVYILDDLKYFTESENISNSYITFITKCDSYYDECNLVLTDNKLFYLDENLYMSEIYYNLEQEIVGNYDIVFVELTNNNHLIAIVSANSIYRNIYNEKSKKFMLKKFLNCQILDYKQYGEKIYIITEDNKILDEDGNILISSNYRLQFHNTLPYVYIKRKDRVGLISLNKNKIILKPIYVEILFDEEEILVLDSVGGAYKVADVDCKDT